MKESICKKRNGRTTRNRCLQLGPPMEGNIADFREGFTAHFLKIVSTKYTIGYLYVK